MARTFEDADTGGRAVKRKWQCFVCGKNYTDYGEYKEHILAEHEEGREFLSCPQCQAPVRDMKAHWKAKHPQRFFPKGIATRATVWRDFKPGGKKKTRKPKVRTGTFISEKNRSEIKYKSGLEEKFLNLLESDRDVASFVYETIKVPYFWAGKWHTYIPDLRVDFIDGSTEVWEIKPADQTDFDQNKAKWASMNDHALNMGWQFYVQTEVALGKLGTKVKRQTLTD
jgi:hypothetical protein